ncbi:MAG: hypothetical protein CVU35_03950 [Betaproteobacteria bacterium HGW-Betaproteobacteria-8]|nr:MAG: hypothetical protein CVU35_03950 [Betaproteobacteria bacterium HGW-Betaproteobacteria-8]
MVKDQAQTARVGKRIHKCCWLVPFILFSADTYAWGLVTHLYFAQSLLWAMPLLDPRLQQAIRKFPELVMAGACLPDLAIVSSEFRHTHLWENAHQLLLSAKNDEETAIAIGYASHLYVDVIAHNHFVPAHEAMWIENSMLTHIASEWAMDAHLSPLIQQTPGQLLSSHHSLLKEFIAPNFRCSLARTSRALNKLAFWDSMLRRFKIPACIYHGSRLADRRVSKHFIYYIATTQRAMADIGTVLEGNRPAWEAELKHLSAQELVLWRRQCLRHLDLRHPAPIEYFGDTTGTASN